MKRIKSQRSQSHKSKSKALILRENLSVSWEKFIEWSREKPYLDYFLDSIFLSPLPILILLIFVLLITGVFYLLNQALLNEKQESATILAGALAFLGVCLTVAINYWMNTSKTRMEQQQDTTEKIRDFYEIILKLIRKPGYYALEEIYKFVDDFDDKVQIYGSNDINYKWLNFNLKEKILRTQKAPTSADSNDIYIFTNFIQAIRKEMGYKRDKTLKFLTYKNLKSEYKKQENSLIDQNSELVTSNNTNSENEQN